MVPLNYANPTGKKIKLALSRKAHTDSDYRGVIFGLAGGPGGSGRQMTMLATSLPKDIGKKYDWIGIDPRGSGGSEPKLECAGDDKGVRHLPYLPQNDAQLQAWKANSKASAEKCATSPAKELLPFMHTTEWVQDLEQVRIALGIERVTLYGISYGTYLGQMYANLHPQRIEKMILDGVVSPQTDWYTLNLQQQAAFGDSMGVYARWLAKYDTKYHLGADEAAVRKKIEDKLGELRAVQIKDPKQRHPEKTLLDALNLAAYGVTYWEAVAMSLNLYINKGDSSILNALSMVADKNVYSVYLSVFCSEKDWPNWDKTLADAKASHKNHPLHSWSNTWFNAPCVDWTTPATPQPAIDSSKVKIPVLLLSETFDAATPLAGALSVRKEIPTSVLVEGVGGNTHSGSLAAGACITDVIYDYLDRGVLPPRVAGDTSDKKCKPVEISPTESAVRYRLPAQVRQTFPVAVKPSN